jgi:DNA mismatch repair protein MutL
VNKIKILSQYEAQKVAAGEVVERPSNIVKELIENAIDAESKNISLYIEKSGKQGIRIIDDGFGMSEEDAEKCFLPHATSKITKIEELESVCSFGFRGEALASISSVSRVTLTTKLRANESNMGVCVCYEAGGIKSKKTVACSEGTSLFVSDLFYNIPVRKKFLKQDETEWNQIQSIFQVFCLSNIKVHFKLFRDGKLIIAAPPVSTVKDRITQLWGHNFSTHIIQLISKSACPSWTQIGMKKGFHTTVRPEVTRRGSFQGKDTNNISKKHDWITISGAVSNHNFWRYNRQHIFLFVNNRWVKNQELSKALLKGYSNVLPPGKFPAAFIFIKINKEHVDVNVHPKKEEVRFVKPNTVQTILQNVIKETLENHVTQQISSQRKEASSETKVEEFLPSEPFFTSPGRDFRFTAPPHPRSTCFADTRDIRNIASQSRGTGLPASTSPQQQIPEETFEFVPIPKINYQNNDARHDSTECVSNKVEVYPKQNQENYNQRSVVASLAQDEIITSKVFVQLFNTYIMIEKEDKLILIDQHAAHERILYEKFLHNFEKKNGILLLFPEIISLPEHQIKLVLREKQVFSNQGIEIDQFGQNELAIKTSPPSVQNQSLKELIKEAISLIEENRHLEKDLFRKKFNEHVHSHMACKAAIKAGDKLTLQQMEKLVFDLQQVNNRFICVHGRPTTWNISKKDIEKQFRRQS